MLEHPARRLSGSVLSELRQRALDKRWAAFRYEASGLSHQAAELHEAANALEAQARELGDLLPYPPAAKRPKKAQYGGSRSRQKATAV